MKAYMSTRSTDCSLLAKLYPGLKIRVGPAGVHLFCRKTGINVLLDEILAPSSIWSDGPRQVSIALTNACNLSCSYCYAPKKPALLPLELLKGWLFELDHNGCIGVGFGGGEPTLYPSLTELCCFAAKETKLAVTMTTHAHQLSNQLLTRLEGNLHFVRVSMDGVGGTYESIRSRSFKTLVERITALSGIVSFGINFVVNSRTFGDLNAATDLAASLGALEFLLLPEQPVRGKGGIDNDTRAALKEWVINYRGSVPLSVSAGNADGLPTCDPVNTEKGLGAFAHIDATGVLKRTSYDQEGVPILENGVMEALRKLKVAVKGEAS